MATLQKIRSKGPLLVIVIGLALFAFIAGDAWKVLQPHQGQQDVGEINGETLSAQEYQKLVDELSEVYKISGGLNSLNEQQLATVKDQVWQNYLSNTLIAAEAEKLGLTVTDAEIQAIIEEGTHPLLMQTPFRNPQTGAFDKDMLKKFLVDYANMSKTQMPAQYAEYYQTLGKFWKFIEKSLRQNSLAEKYQNLIARSLISNPIAAEDAFNGHNQQTDVILASVPFSSISDSTITVSNDEIRDLYNQRKEQYKQMAETRDIRFIDVHVLPSDADRKAVEEEVTDYSNQLAETTKDYATFIRTTGSEIAFNEVPVGKTALSQDVAAHLESAKENEVYGPYYNQADDSYNAFKIIDKISGPNSIEFRQIQVYAENEAKTTALADSIFKALKGGAKFEEVAKIYGQSGEKTTVTANSWEGAPVTGDNAKFINALIGQPVNELANVKIGQANVILQVMNKTDMQDKYKVAVIKRNVEFSKETYNEAYNKFSQFVAQTNTIEDMNKNAEENGYTVIPMSDFSSASHYVGGVHSTREVLRWIFAAEEGEVSSLYECGDNDHMMMVAVEKINPAGYRNINNVAASLRAEIRNNKKADMIMANLKNCTSIDQVKAVKDVVTDSVKHITFNAPAYLSKTRSNEPVVSGVASKTAVNKLSAPFKGYNGVYMVQVYNRANGEDKLDSKQEENMWSNSAARVASQMIFGDLYDKAEIIDRRYLYF